MTPDRMLRSDDHNGREERTSSGPVESSRTAPDGATGFEVQEFAVQTAGATIDPGNEAYPAERDDLAAEQAPLSQGGLLRNSAVMAGASILSRITGIFRNTALTAALGLTISADTFALGNSLPQIVYALVVGGALSAIFVPQLVRRMKDDADGGQAYTDTLLSATGAVLAVLTVAAVLLAPLIVDLYVTDSYDPAQVSLAIAFARYCLPQVFFFGLYTMLTQVLNARGVFGVPMLAPIFNNIVNIVVYVSFIYVFGTAAANEGLLNDEQAAWLGIGTTLGIIAQALVLIPALWRTGYRFRFSRKWRGMGLGKAGRLAGWTIGLVAATQASFLVISRLATQANVNASEAGTTAAGLATYTNAYLVFMIPHGIITVSIVTAQLPGLSGLVHAQRMREAGHQIGHAMRLAMTVITPVALALFLGGASLAAMLFSYGAADANQAYQLGQVISMFMLGLPAFTLYFVLQRGWYAMEDTRTPFVFAVLTNVVIVLMALLMFNRAEPGAAQVSALALAYSIGYVITLLVAWPALLRGYGTLDSRRTVVTLGKLAFAGAGAYVIGLAVSGLLGLTFELGDSRMIAALDLTITSAVIVVAFTLLALLARVAELKELLAWGAGPLRRLTGKVRSR